MFHQETGLGSRIKVSELQNIKRLPLALILLFTEFSLIILFVAFGKYCPDADASDQHNSIHPVHGGFELESNTILKYRERKNNAWIFTRLNLIREVAFLVLHLRFFCSVPRCARHDFPRFRLFNDVPASLRI